MKNCKVCAIGIIVQGSLFCEACRSFYRRQIGKRNNDPLKCKSGTFNCRLIAQTTSVFGNQNSPYRFICRACRMKRCMELVSDSQSGQQTLSKLDIPVEQHGELEDNLALIIKAKNAILNNMKHSQLRKNDNSKGPEESWLDFMGDFPKLIVNMKSYGNFFPAFAKLSIKDRITFFMKTRFGLLAGEGLLDPEDYYITGINSANFNKFRQRASKNPIISPILDRMGPQAEKSWIQIQNIKLTPLEQAFFLAFLFFDGTFSLVSHCFFV